MPATFVACTVTRVHPRRHTPEGSEVNGVLPILQTKTGWRWDRSAVERACFTSLCVHVNSSEDRRRFVARE